MSTTTTPDNNDQDTRQHSNGWCCVDCLQWLANGETPPDWDEEKTAAWLAEIGKRTNGADGGTITLGRMFGEDRCSHDADDWDEDPEAHAEECERITFSSSPCDVCGSHLAGERAAVTFWLPDRCDCEGALHYTTCWWCVHNDDGRDQRTGDPELDAAAEDAYYAAQRLQDATWPRTLVAYDWKEEHLRIASVLENIGDAIVRHRQVTREHWRTGEPQTVHLVTFDAAKVRGSEVHGIGYRAGFVCHLEDGMTDA